MITLLDGSIGQELVKRHGAAPTPLWSTYVMLENPDIVSDVHLDYFRAGAEIATMNTYAILRDRLRNNGIEDKFEALHRAAQDHAARARDAFGGGKIASAIGPLGASYRPDLMPPVDEAAEQYAEIVALHDDFADLHLLETVAGLGHVEGILEGCREAKKPVWLSLTVDDADGTKLRSGEALADVAAFVTKYAPAAVLINCSTPEAVDQAMPILAGFGAPFGAYANGFTKITDEFKVVQQVVDDLKARTDLDPAAYANFAKGWVDQGATIIGGCCEVGPEHIKELARQFKG